MGPGASGSHPVRCTYFTAYMHTYMQTNKMRNHIYCNRVPREVEVDEVGVSRFFSHERTKEREPVVCLFVCLFFSWWVSE